MPEAFTPVPGLSRDSSRVDIYERIDSLPLFHQHLAYYEGAPAWQRLYSCVRSYKRSHPALPDIATAYQHHRLQVLGQLSSDDKTPSVDRLRKRKDRAAKQLHTGTVAVTTEGERDGEQPLPSISKADLSATMSLTSILSSIPAKDCPPKCRCGTMVILIVTLTIHCSPHIASQ